MGVVSALASGSLLCFWDVSERHGFSARTAQFTHRILFESLAMPVIGQLSLQ